MKNILIILMLFCTLFCTLSCSKEDLPISVNPIVANWELNRELYSSVYEGITITPTKATFYFSNQSPSTYFYFIKETDGYDFDFMLARDDTKDSIIGKWATIHFRKEYMHVDLTDELNIENQFGITEKKKLIFERY